ncbi:tetratricopeptide repeat protein [Flavobacterium mesophilum]|uniref:tetratricopeptide repeat protein n=1 Tax=Flavobacterium mesophilum TaxID=3143495 RepID=UPI0031DD49CC
MNKFFTLSFFILSLIVSAQNSLQFDKKFVQSEDRWVAFSADSIGNHPYGFIYIDSQAGLTFDYEGTFKIDEKGKFISTKKELQGAMKYRLEPNNNLVAFIPESKFTELQIQKLPDWLKGYKTDEGSIDRLYKWGYMYNGWNECEKALEFLEKANKINSDYKGLQVELAFSYNCLKRYNDAITVLNKAVKQNPLDSYTNKELIYALVKNGDLEEAKNVYRKVLKEVKDKTYNSENAYNILQAYFLKKDIKNFDSWLSEANSELMSQSNFKNLVGQMKTELNLKN